MSTASADPYFPNHGDLAYAVEHYDIVVDYKVDTNHLAGRATLTCRARRAASTFTLDLHGLRVAKVTLDGAPPRRFRHRAGRLVIEPAQPLAAGASFEVVVTYSGHPGTVHGADDGAGWEELTDGVLVAGQPNGAPTWFPCNDRPSTKGTYTFTVATPPAYTTVANGTLVERHATSSRVVWRYEVREPMASYLATLQIGRYQSRRQAGSRVPVTIHAPASRWMAVDSALGEQPAMMRVFEDLFGPYPFDAYAVVVADDDLEIPLESQSLSTFGPNHMTTSWTNQRLVAHELAHQWFGNSLTAGQWSDIWLHEGFACYAEWIWSESSGRETAGQHAVRHWERLASLPQDLVLTDPGPIEMFDDRLYKRGALTLHALRMELGDDAFFSALQSWVGQNRYGSVTTEQFVTHMADHVPGRSSVIRALLTSWLYSKELPDWK